MRDEQSARTAPVQPDQPTVDGQAREGPLDGAGLGEGFDFHALLGIADSLPVMMAFCSTDLQFRFVNRPLADWFECPRSQLLGRSIKDVMNARTYETRRPLLEAAAKGQRQLFVAEFHHPTRGLLTTRSEYIPHYDARGEIAGIVLVIQDVSEQRSTEIALRESEARFRRIADSAPVLMWVSRKDGSRDFANEACREYFGDTVVDDPRSDWTDRIHPDDRGRVVETIRSAREKGTAYDLIGRLKTREGEYRWLHAVGQPRFDPEGNFIGHIGTASDVTGTKEAELELRREVADQQGELAQTEARFQAVFESLEMVGIMALDGSYLEVNRSVVEGLGITIEEMRGHKPWEIAAFAPFDDSKEKLVDMVERAAAGESVTGEMTIRTIEGDNQIMVTIKPVTDADGKPLFLVGEGRDVTELKIAQDQLRQAQKMEALGQLTGGIAHDFNNLLTVVVGGLDLIAKRVEDEKLKRYAENALSAAERGARLTGQLLAFSRTQRLEVAPVTVGRLIEEMRPLLRNVLGPGIEKQFDFQDQDMKVMADSTQLEVAILNLAINARDAMTDGGLLRFASRRVTVSEDHELEPGDYIELSIADTGEGMPQDVVDRAFDPFFTTKEVGKGTGLGLSMVYGMARQSGGTARIASMPGEGTTVLLYLRNADDKDEGRGVPVSGSLKPRCDTRGKKVLVVDDDEQVRSYICASLDESGYAFAEAADGETAMKLLKQFEPDVVILDYIMPGRSGAEIAAAMLEKDPDLPILFVSGYNETDAIREAAPDAALLAKPFRPDALDAAICDLLGD
ncbi:hybrid sensor histidine kinase/response regulator [Sphingomicrobium lutaoense]|nr:PAS domain-containing protein [Sphingomicrobium lutaoense]